MTAQTHSMLALIRALAGPIIWTLHFFFLYLLEVFACTGQGAPTGVIRWMGIAVTAAALGILALCLRPVRALDEHRRGTLWNEASLAFAGPLTLLSMAAIVWTSTPLFLLPACVPAYHVMSGG